MGEKLKSYFRKIAISAEILAKKIQKGITIDSAARKELAASIKRLESEKENLADVGEKFGVAFRTAFDAEMSKSLGSFFDVKVKTVKSPTLDEPTSGGDGGDGGNSFEGTTKGAKEATAAVIAHKSALVDLSNAQALQTKEIGSNLEALNQVPVSMSRIEATMGRLKEKTGLYKEELASFNEGLTNIANQGMNDLANGIGEMAGAMAAGTMTIGDVGRNLVGALAGILGQIGKLAIQTGIATLGIKAALQTLNPAGAIAGGIALVALSKLVKAKMSSAVPLAEGGILTKPVFSGGFLAGEAGPEAVIPLDKLDTMLSGSGSKNVNVSGQFQIKGRDLVYVLNKEKAAQNRYS
jgi:hypothetical protein